tara:strand:+ start:499 stop:669 length:171 start_codon:yes stop_codon:yes gene_type:complete
MILNWKGNMKDKKKEKEWLEEPTISFEVVDGELTIVGNPFDKEEETEQGASSKPQD